MTAVAEGAILAANSDLFNKAPLFTTLNDKITLEFEMRHKEIIDHFGRYPHRNGILNRVSTPEEILFLKKSGSSF
ncbi:DUF924 family protein [Arsenophonus endosymbiont of Aphis craccivora]|nr:DUF924 family protein [Arsenophonus endosymbiont of Aphis craccivora]